MSDAPIRTIAVVVSASEPPRVHPIRGALGPQMTLGDEVFRDSGAGDWHGFYDWLRTASGDVIGITLWVDEPIPLLRAVAECTNVVAGENCRPLTIYFGEVREFEARISDDQDFGDNMLLLSSKRFALTFNAPTPMRLAGI